MLSRIFIALLIIANLHAGASTTEHCYYFGDYNLIGSGEYTQIQFENTRQFGETGRPMLPFCPVILVLPPGEAAESIEITGMNEVMVPGNIQLMPQQAVRPVSAGSSGSFIKDESIYSSVDRYPGDLNYKANTHFMNGYAIAVSAFTPVIYRPASGTVSYYSVVKVIIRTRPDRSADAALKNLISSSSVTNRILQLSDNPEMLRDYRSPVQRTDDYQYLILTKAQYTAEFDTLVRFYLPRGIRSKVFSSEYIDASGSGQDLQEKIRNFIIDEYQDHEIEYVLIGGDIEVIPCRGFYCNVYSQNDSIILYDIPADLYYSALDGTWNDDGDDRWAEPNEDDLLPEVAVGRLTFSDTAELHNMLHKSMSYQANPVQGELTHPLLAAEWLYGYPYLTWGEDYINLLIGLHSNNGYTTQGIPPSQPIDSLYERQQNWSKYDLMNKINQGKPWLHHCGHANYTSLMYMSNSDITDSNFSQANGINHNYTIIYTHGCNCGGFDHNDCIAERMIGIDNFAVAFVGNSRYGWFNEGTTDGPSIHLHREFVDAIYSDSLYHAGMALLKSKLETAPFVGLSPEWEPGAIRWCFYDNNLLGDPMLAMWTDEPHPVDVTYMPLVPIGADSVEVIVTASGIPQKGFSCSIIQQDTLLGSAVTDSTGRAVINIDDYLQEGEAGMYVAGYNILPAGFSFRVADYWLGYSTDWNDTLNWFTGDLPDQNTDIIIPCTPFGNHFPMTNSGTLQQCRSLLLETGAILFVPQGDTLEIHGN